MFMKTCLYMIAAALSPAADAAQADDPPSFLNPFTLRPQQIAAEALHHGHMLDYTPPDNPSLHKQFRRNFSLLFGAAPSSPHSQGGKNIHAKANIRTANAKRRERRAPPDLSGLLFPRAVTPVLHPQR
jgi:hypothetical protein